MELVEHVLGDYGRQHSGLGVVTFYRCTFMMDGGGNGRKIRCGYCRPNKYQSRTKRERHK